MMGKGTKPLVAVLLINWNNSDLTLECLESLKSVSYPNFYVIVTDNGSDDGSVERLNKFARKTKEFTANVIENGENLGFSGGTNSGIRQALRDGADYMILLNNDSVVHGKFLDKLVEVGENYPKAGILAPTVYFYYMPKLVWFGGDTKIQWHNVDKTIEWENELFKKELPQGAMPQKVSFITGAAMMIKRAVAEQVGLFDERFFLYFEDADYVFRTQKAGWNLMWVPGSTVWHKVSATTLTKVGSPKLHYYHTRNGMLLSKKHAPAWLCAWRPLWALYKGKKQIIKLILIPKADNAVSLAIMRGIFDYYRGRFGKYPEKLDK